MKRRVDNERIRAIIGKVAKPEKVWQRQFDHFDDTLRQIARCDWDAVPEADLWEYFNDLAYVEDLQPDLFRHLFPTCVKFWYDTLIRSASAEAGSAEFHHALHRGQILWLMLTPHQRDRTFDVFIDGMMDRIDLEDGSWFGRRCKCSHSIVARFNSLGYIAPITASLLGQWGSLDRHGKSVAAVMYASGLVYFEGENPIYPKHTCEEGGGGPYLTESDSTILDAPWLPENLEALQQTLSAGFIVDSLAVAASNLRDHAVAGVAARIAADAAERQELIELRLSELVGDLARPALQHELWR